jgi:CheY-specific phosphatase CheX
VEPMRALRDAISEVLETMCFMCPVPVKAPAMDLDPAEDWAVVELDFGGKDAGSLRIYFPWGLAVEMASAMRGQADTIAQAEETHDVLKEVTNMVAGSLLHRLDPEAKASLQLPRVVTGAQPWDPARGLAMDLDGRMIVAQLLWESEGDN